ncbi:PadR family transcriptional regulator [Micropruina sonneratiae]|uniref:PadR family transcriptional regulator n=1 Tax=Micropruina sonneratiae TaxID=2986940 RepID=UPI002227E429|nr:PadR family transcriptional regulator [Micropruina sp. KQZ13P-5]MCW3158317.1 PadR family transcriptional regulator [Micropruina sp. KQZ13P-5]
MQFVILGLLLSEPLTLYEVRTRFTAGISLFYSASFGSLQRALQVLVRDGSVTVTAAQGDARGRKLHAITEQGERQWREWMLAPVEPGVEAERVILAKVFLLGRLRPADRAVSLAGVRAAVAEQADALGRLASELDAVDVPAEHRGLYHYQRATLDYGLRSSAVLLDWVDELSGDLS